MNRSIARRLVAAALAGGFAAACGKGSAKQTGTGLEAATAEVRDIVSSVEATGTIEPIKLIDVKSQASGEILEMPVQLGDYVQKGALLVRIDPRDVRNAYLQAKADLDVAKASYSISERQLERERALHDSAMVSDSELETATLNAANANAALVKAQTNLQLASDRLNDVDVKAPISGTVIEKDVEEGQNITGTREVTGGTLILRMADLAEVQVRTLVDETDIGRIQPGLPASIQVEAYPDRKFEGKVLQIEPQAVVNQNVTMFAVLTRIRNENDLLRPGMNADVEVVVGERDSVLALPNTGIKTPEEAQQLAQVLGLDPSLLKQSIQPATPGQAGSSVPTESADQGSAATSTGPDADLIARASKLRGMSQDERMRFFQSLSAADRQKLMDYFRQQREQQQAADRANPGRPKPAFVFVETPEGSLTLKPVLIGLGNFDYTEIVQGLKAGDQVVEVPLSLVQQGELLQRIRSRTGLPGLNRSQ